MARFAPSSGAARPGTCGKLHDPTLMQRGAGAIPHIPDRIDGQGLKRLQRQIGATDVADKHPYAQTGSALQKRHDPRGKVGGIEQIPDKDQVHIRWFAA